MNCHWKNRPVIIIIDNHQIKSNDYSFTYVPFLLGVPEINGNFCEKYCPCSVRDLGGGPTQRHGTILGNR